jgi:hypothetical protein
MRIARQFGLVLVTVLVLSAIAVSGASAAPEFLSSVNGGKLTAKSLTTQTFVTKAGNVECTVVNLTGGTAASLSTTQEATIQYEKCKAFGINATVTPALYDFHADGSVALLNNITITTLTCVVHVPAAGNGNLNTVKYDNTPTNILLLPNVKLITYTALTGCPFVGTAEDGTYTGNSEVGLAGGGTISWMA